MSDIDVLKEMLKDAVKVQLDSYSHTQKNKITLTESQSQKYEVEIHGMPDNDQVIVIRADSFEAPKKIFENSRHECKRADFVIVANTDEVKVVVIIELKAGKGGTETEIIQQLKGAQCFVAYCKAIGQAFWPTTNFLENYQYRFVSIRNISISKRSTRSSGTTVLHDCPDRMLKLTSPKGLQFNRLVLCQT